MIGRIFGALVGGAVANRTKAVGGTTGAVLGAAVPMVLRRVSIPGMIVLGAGGYAAKKYFFDSDDNDRSTRSTGDTASKDTATVDRSTPQTAAPAAPAVTTPPPG